MTVENRVSKGDSAGKSMTSINDDFNRLQYETFFRQYLESNKDHSVGGKTPDLRVNMLQTFLPVGRKVLEIGSGIGGDAEALKKAGYEVTTSDITDGFLEVLKSKGFSPLKLDAKRDFLPSNMDAIYANAVLVHFSPDELSLFLQKAGLSLQKERIFFLSVIKGEGFERSSRARGFERDFHYYNQDNLGILLETAGFQIGFKLFRNTDAEK